ncbi:MAG: hypothetical protein K8R77_15950 [Anaerolineaceae bacterium]|nr:hypothetical protein [Anaerolineaceae bacterium]
MNTAFNSILILACGALAIYLLARLFSARNELLACCTVLVFFLAGLVLFSKLNLNSKFWLEIPSSGEFMVSGEQEWPGESASRLIAGTAIALGFLVSLYSSRYLEQDQRYKTYYPLLLLTVAGLVGMVYTTDLFLLYLFIEWMSVCAYVLVAFRRQTNTATEAGFKYLIMGSVGTILFLLGLAWIFRVTGQIKMPLQAAETSAWASAGLVCILTGLGIKSAFVPLHTWLPDAHSRAPSSISALLSGIIIQSCFFVWLRVGLGLGVSKQVLGAVLIWLSIANMIVGNFMALVQIHVKRLLAFSSIAQMGYILFSFGIGLYFDFPQAILAGFLYLVIHAALKSLAFLSKGICHFYYQTTLIEDMRGIAKHLPLAALTLSLSLAGLAGLPPLIGFSGKWFILTSALSTLQPLALVGTGVFLLTNLISLGYYLPLIAQLYASQPHRNEAAPTLRISPWMAIPVIALSGLILAASIYPAPWVKWLSPIIFISEGG